VATISTRLTNAGTLLVNGTIDEVTFNTTAGNSAIVNQAVYSQNPSGTGWTGYGRTVTANYALAPDGTSTAARIVETSNSVNTIHGFGQAQTNYVAGNRYTISFYMKSYSANRAFIFGVGAEVTGGVVGTNYVYAKCDPDLGTIANNLVYAPAAQTTAVTNAGNGWYRFSLSFLAANTTTKGVDIQFQGGAGKNQQTYIGDGTSGVLIWGLQIEVGGSASTYQGITTANTLITPTWSVKTVPDTIYSTGNFDEVTYNSTAPVIKNLLWQTQNWTANIQSQPNVSVTANSILAPDGTQTGSTITTTVGGYNNDALIQKWNPTGISTAALPYCLSVYVKQGNCPTIGMNLAFYNGNTYQDAILTLTWSNLSIATTGSNTGTLNYGVIDTGLGWYRLWCSATNNYSAVGVVGRIWVRSVYNNNIAGDYNYAWGMQIEQGSSPTIYQGKGASTILTPNFARREDQTGNIYVTNSYDEYTGAPVVDSGLLWWTDGGQTTSYSGSGTTVRNLANTAQSGTISGNVIYSSVDGGKFVFSDYLDTTNTISAGNIGYPASVNDPWTMEAWIYVPTGATWSINNNVGPLYIRGSYNGTHGLVRMQADNTVAVWLRGNTTALAYRTGVTTRDRWNQVVGVWTGGAGGNLQCYVNGTLTQASTTTQDDPLKSTLFYAIGAANTGLSNNSGAVFVGNISSTKLYNRALTADEVAQNFNALRRRYNI